MEFVATERGGGGAMALGWGKVREGGGVGVARWYKSIDVDGELVRFYRMYADSIWGVSVVFYIKYVLIERGF